MGCNSSQPCCGCFSHSVSPYLHFTSVPSGDNQHAARCEQHLCPEGAKIKHTTWEHLYLWLPLCRGDLSYHTPVLLSLRPWTQKHQTSSYVPSLSCHSYRFSMLYFKIIYCHFKLLYYLHQAISGERNFILHCLHMATLPNWFMLRCRASWMKSKHYLIGLGSELIIRLSSLWNSYTSHT